MLGTTLFVVPNLQPNKEKTTPHLWDSAFGAKARPAGEPFPYILKNYKNYAIYKRKRVGQNTQCFEEADLFKVID